MIESETVWEWPASTDHVGGSLGLMARERAVLINREELSSIVLAETRIGSWACDPCGQEGIRTERTSELLLEFIHTFCS